MVRSTPSGAADTAEIRVGRLDVLLLGLLALAWGSAYIFIREGIVLGASPLEFAGARYLLSAVLFAALAAARREPWPERRAAGVSALLGGILVIGLYGGCLYWGEQYTTGGYAAVLSTTAPILSVAFAFLLLPAERLSRLALLGIAVGAIGVVVLVLPSLRGGAVGTWPGPLFVIAAFVCAAAGTVLLRRYGRGRQGLWQIGVQFLVGGLLLFGLVAGLPYPERLPLSSGVLGALAALVLFSSVVGYFVYFTLHHRVGPVRANAVAYLLPVVGVGIGSGLLGEPWTLWELGGFVVVLLGVTLVLGGSRSA